jgi:hypothetical protein
MLFILNSGLENREYGRGDPLRWPRDTLYPQKLALTSLTGCGRSVGIVRLRTKATEFFFGLYSENNTEHISTPCEQNAYFLNAKTGSGLQ